MATTNEALFDPESLSQFAAENWDLNVPLPWARQILGKGTRCLNLNSLKNDTIRICGPFQRLLGPPCPRPEINPNRVNYPFDDQVRVSGRFATHTVSPRSYDGRTWGFDGGVKALEEVRANLDSNEIMI